MRYRQWLKLCAATLAFINAVAFSGLSYAQPAEADSGKTLIVYLSRTQNTKAVAEMIQRQTGGDLHAVEVATPYPVDYQQMVKQVHDELERNYLPPLKNRIDLSKYQRIFFGFPTWSMQLPPPMQSFLTQNDLRGKTLIPFNTNGGYGLGKSIDTLKRLCRGCVVKQVFSTKGGSERDGQLFMLQGARADSVRQEVRRWLADIDADKQAE